MQPVFESVLKRDSRHLQVAPTGGFCYFFPRQKDRIIHKFRRAILDFAQECRKIRLIRKVFEILNVQWRILFCDEYLDSCPVEEFIESRSGKQQVKILRFLSLLEEKGPNLPRPYADYLFDGVHELRIKLSGEQLRLLYFFCYRRFIILYYAFIKNTDRVPEKFIQKVIKYREDFLERNHPEDLAKIFDEEF